MIISGIASVKTYAIVKSEPRKIEDVGAELREEGTRIIDYGIYNEQEVTVVIQDFIEDDYSEYFFSKTQNTGLLFIYGNAVDLYSMEYMYSQTGTVSATIGGVEIGVPIENAIAKKTEITAGVGEIITVGLLGKEFEFEVKDNEMFYFIISQEKEGEVYIETNKDE